MDCQICLRRLERFEPVYRMQFGPGINSGWRTSVCSRCLSAFVENLKRPGLRCGAPHCFVGNGVKVFCIERGYVVTLFRGLQTEIVPEVLTDRVKEPNRRGASVVERF